MGSMNQLNVWDATAFIKNYLSEYIEIRVIDLSFKDGDHYKQDIYLTIFYCLNGAKETNSTVRVGIKDNHSIELLIKNFCDEIGIDVTKKIKTTFTTKI